MAHERAKEKARVSIIDHGSGKKYQVILPTNVETKRVLPTLVKQLNLPTEGPGGAGTVYDLAVETEDGRVRLEDDETLAEAGVQDGTILRITPRMRGGN